MTRIKTLTTRRTSFDIYLFAVSISIISVLLANYFTWDEAPQQQSSSRRPHWFLTAFATTAPPQGLTQYERAMTPSVPTSSGFSFPFLDADTAGVTNQILLFGNASFQSFHGYKALRLTSSTRYQTGAVYYYDSVPLKYGFDMTVKFRIYIDKPNQYGCMSCGERATELGDVIENGGDGFAFVFFNLQHRAPGAANTTLMNDTTGFMPYGSHGQGLGYAGINNSVAVEVDCWRNEQLFDPYPGHISVITHGTEPNTPSHTSHFQAMSPPAYGSTSMYGAGDPDPLWDPMNPNVKYVYPNITPPFNIVPIIEVFDGRQHTLRIKMIENGTFSEDKKDRIDIYFDDMTTPRSSVSINLADTIMLTRDRRCLSFYGCYHQANKTCIERLSDDVPTLVDDLPSNITTTVMDYANSIRWEQAQKGLRRWAPDPMVDIIPNQLESVKNDTGCDQCVGYEACMGFIGFTAATGAVFQNHDLFSWTWDATMYNNPPRENLTTVPSV